MNHLTNLETHEAPPEIPINPDFIVNAQPSSSDENTEWSPVAAYAIPVSSINTSSDTFDHHNVSLASINIRGPVKVKAQYTAGTVSKAEIRPLSYGIKPAIEGNIISFTLDKPLDVMLEVNGNKWDALHLLVNSIDPAAPHGDTEDIWFFGPGINQGSAFSQVVDGNLHVPSGKTLYLASGAFLTARVNFINVSKSAIRGPGFIYEAAGGAILIEGSHEVSVEGVTSLSATGFSLTVGESSNIHIDKYRSFSSHGNGDGVDLFCSKDILVENCFLRNSDDTIALYSHRWDYYGDSYNITIRNCVLLPDIAHPINIGTHGNPENPETIRDVTISNIDILDHEENQLWYQGCIAINAGDANLVENVHVENVRIEKISKGQLINFRVMQNGMWTTAPGRGIRNVTLKNIELNMDRSDVVNPSQILGYDGQRKVESITFENLKIGDQVIHDGMVKPRWYMVSDFVPMFINEHATEIGFKSV